MDQAFLQSAEFIDSAASNIRNYAEETVCSTQTQLEMAVALYYRVRDGIRYTPYLNYGDPQMYRASSVLRNGYGFCISKASLLAACGRALGIPSRIGFADVTNHLVSPRLLEMNGSELMRWHAYTEFHLEDRWVKATPAFNLELCSRFRVKPLEFDGLSDSIFHPFDADQRKHLEYVNDHGTFADVPFKLITATYKKHNPNLLRDNFGGDFGTDANPPAP